MNKKDSMKIEYEKIGNFRCQCAYFNKTEINKVILWPGQMGFEQVIKLLEKKSPKKDFIVLAFQVNSWDNDLSPWESKKIKGEYFNGDGQKTLNYITNELLPFFEKKFPEIKHKPKIIGGYSLSGLFSLYAFYSTDIFIGVGGFSPSLWFEDWNQFTNTNKAKNKDSIIYLSLGDIEEKNNSGHLSIGNKVKEFYKIVKNDKNVKDCIYEINKGDHYQNIDDRIAKGFAWLLKKF